MTRTTPTSDLLARLDALGVPRKRIAELLLIQPSAVSDLFAGRRQLKYDEAVQLMAAFAGEQPQGARQLPVIGMAGAGNWLEAIADPDDTITLPYQAGKQGQFAVAVSGESMNQLLPHGSVAIIEPAEREVYVGQIYLLQNTDGEGTIKRFRDNPARFEPVSNDPSFAPILIGTSDFQVIGRVTGAVVRF